MTKEKVKRFWEEHKAAIIATTTIAVGAVVSVVLHQKVHNNNQLTTQVVHTVTAPKKELNLEIPEGLVNLGVTEWDALTEDVVEFMLPFSGTNGYPIKVNQLHEMVDAICDIPGITENHDVWALVSIGRNAE